MRLKKPLTLTLSFSYPHSFPLEDVLASPVASTPMAFEGRLLQMAATGARGVSGGKLVFSGRSSICIYLEGVSRQTTIVIYINALPTTSGVVSRQPESCF